MTYAVVLRFPMEKILDAVHARCRNGSRRLGREAAEAAGPYVPYDTGRLAGDVSVTEAPSAAGDAARVRILWHAPYARDVYYGDARGMVFSREKHARATARWFEAAKCASLNTWTAHAAEEIGGYGKRDGSYGR